MHQANLMACYKNIWRDFTYPQHPKFTYPGQDRLFPVTRLTTLDLHSVGVELINSLLYGTDQNGKLFIHLTRIRIRPPLLTKNNAKSIDMLLHISAFITACIFFFSALVCELLHFFLLFSRSSEGNHACSFKVA